MLEVRAQDDTDIDTPGLQVDFQIGLAGRVFPRVETLVSFEVHNQTGEVIDGTLEMDHVQWIGPQATSINGALTFVPASSQPFKLGQQSKQRFSIYNHVGDNRVRLRFRDSSGEVLWQRTSVVETFNELRHFRLRVLTLDEKSRMLPLGPENKTDQWYWNGRNQAHPDVRSIDFMHAEPWAFPQYRRHLALVDAILLGELPVQALSDRQWQALADYLAYGGVVFLRQEDEALEDHLLRHLPFDKPDRTSRKVEIGQGLLLRYPSQLLGAVSDEHDFHWLYPEIDRRPRMNLSTRLAVSQSQRIHGETADGPRAIASRQRLLLFAGLFTLLTGPTAWFFRRWPRRRFLIVMSAMIVLFSGIAIMLGFQLTKIQGELWWTTLTEINPSGHGLQTLAFEMDSAGARKHELILSDPNAAFLPIPRIRQRRELARTPMPIGQGHTEVNLLPWMKTGILAEAYTSSVRPFQVELALDKEKPEGTLRIGNPNAFNLLSASVRIYASADRYHRRFDSFRQTNGDTISVIRGSLPPGSPLLDQDQPITFEPSGSFGELVIGGDESGQRLGLDVRSMNLVSYASVMGETNYTGYLIVEIDRSPGATVTGDDFAASAGRHIIVQRLTLDQLPPYKFFFH